MDFFRKLFNKKQTKSQSDDSSIKETEQILSVAYREVVLNPLHSQTSKAIINRYPGLQITEDEAYALLIVETVHISGMATFDIKTALSLIIMQCGKLGRNIDSNRASSLWEIMDYFRNCADEYKEFFKYYLK